jgi:hypothetical protein
MAYSLAGALTLMLVVPAVQAQFEFGIPTPFPDSINASGPGGISGAPSLSPDQLSMFYTSNRTESVAGSLDVWVTSRASLDAAWGLPVNLGETINSPLEEMGSSITEDGLELYFERTTDFFTHFDGDIWVSKRAAIDDPWGEPESLPLNTPGREAWPSISSDGLVLMFDSNRTPPPGFPTPGGATTYLARRSSRLEPFGEPEAFVISGAGRVTTNGLIQTMSAIEAEADFLGTEHYGGFNDVLMRTRDSVDDEWGAWQTPPPPANSAYIECCADVSADHSTYYFTTDRPGGPGAFNVWQAPIAQSVPVDIKPGSHSTPINLKSKGVLPVAILSTADFDSTQVDPETLRFGDPLLIADGKSPVSPLRWSYEDVNDDGAVDLSLKFSMRDLLASEVIGPATTEGYIAGQMFEEFGSMEIAGREMVTLVPRRSPVPEPASVWLLLFACVSLIRCRSH